MKGWVIGIYLVPVFNRRVGAGLLRLAFNANSPELLYNRISSSLTNNSDYRIHSTLHRPGMNTPGWRTAPDESGSEAGGLQSP